MKKEEVMYIPLLESLQSLLRNVVVLREVIYEFIAYLVVVPIHLDNTVNQLNHKVGVKRGYN